MRAVPTGRMVLAMVVSALSAGSTGTAARGGAIRYDAKVIDPLPGDNWTSGRAINNAGQVAIDSTVFGTDADMRYTVYNADGTAASSGLGLVNGMNGFGRVAVGDQRGVNDRGQIIGGDPGSNAYVQDGSTRADLAAIAAPELSGLMPRAINNAGQVTGFAGEAQAGRQTSFLYADGKIIDLGISFSPYGGNAINEHGDVVGGQSLLSKGIKTDLGTLGGGDANALGLNDLLQIVGTSSIDPVGDHRAFLHENSRMVDLNDLIDPRSGLTLFSARGINDSGQILADGTLADGSYRAVLLTPSAMPVPEPGVGWFASAGIVALALRRGVAVRSR